MLCSKLFCYYHYYYPSVCLSASAFSYGAISPAIFSYVYFYLFRSATQLCLGFALPGCIHFCLVCQYIIFVRDSVFKVWILIVPINSSDIEG